jgi:hypothetical protein
VYASKDQLWPGNNGRVVPEDVELRILKEQDVGFWVCSPFPYDLLRLRPSLSCVLLMLASTGLLRRPLCVHPWTASSSRLSIQLTLSALTDGPDDATMEQWKNVKSKFEHINEVRFQLREDVKPDDYLHDRAAVFAGVPTWREVRSS